MENKKTKILLWSPRVSAFIFAAVLVAFSYKAIPAGISIKDLVVGLLFQSTSGANFKDIAIELLIQNIPALIIIAIIIISWNYEKTGGIAFVLVGFAHMIKSVIDHNRLGIEWYTALALSLMLALPAIAIGALYLVNWFKRKATMPLEVNDELQEEDNEEESEEEAT